MRKFLTPDRLRALAGLIEREGVSRKVDLQIEREFNNSSIHDDELDRNPGMASRYTSEPHPAQSLIETLAESERLGYGITVQKQYGDPKVAVTVFLGPHSHGSVARSQALGLMLALCEVYALHLETKKT